MTATVVDRAVTAVRAVEGVALAVTATLLGLTVSGVVPNALIVEVLVLDVLWITAAAITIAFVRTGTPVRAAWGETLRRATPGAPRRFFAFEWSMARSLVRTVLRRPPIVPAGATPLAAARGGTVLLVGFPIALALEAVVVEWLVPWLAVRVVLHLGTVYAVVMLFGAFARRRQFVHYVVDGTLVLRRGHHEAVHVPIDAIMRIRTAADASTLSDGVENGIARLPGPDGCTHAIELDRDVTFSVHGIVRTRIHTARELRFATAEPALADLLRRGAG